ncbi:MAG: TonB-dependent receptor [Myxococcota bacterium]
MRRLVPVLMIALLSSTALADVRTEARRHFRRGMQLIQQGEVDEGIAELEVAYDTLPHPNVLYNIGRAYAESNRYDEAIEYFERYLASDPPDREEVNGFLSALRARISAQQPEEDPAPEEPEVPVGASDEEIEALEESATQIETLAEATQSDSLRQRAQRLRQVAQSLRERRDAPTVVEPPPDPVEPAEEPPEEPALELELGEEREDDIYEEQVVSASRFAQSPLDAPNAVTTITRQDIRLSGLVNIGELLRRVPGADVMTNSPADTSVSFRGFNQRLSPRVLVLVDGRSINLDPLGNVLWHSIPFNVEDIERIEVIRGPASALYGADAFSGIVNIITRSPGEPRTDVVFGGGNGGRLHAHVSTSGREGRFGYRIMGGYNQADRFSREVGDDRVDHFFPIEERNLALRSAHASTHLRYRLSREAELYLQGGVADAFQNFQGTGPLRDFVSEGPFGHAVAGLNTSWGSIRAFWNGLFAEASLPTPTLGGDALSSRFRWNTFDIEGEFAREFHFLVDHNLHLGASYRRKQIDWDFLSEEQFENHGAVFFQDTLRILEQLIVVASFRLDFHPLLDDPVFSPRGAVVVRPTPGSAFRASVGTAFRTQTFLESYLQLRNPTPVDGIDVLALGSESAASLLGKNRLTPERILSAELGYRNADSEYFDFEVSAYYNRVTDLVLLSQVDAFTLAENGRGVGGYSPGQGSFSLGTISFENDPTEFDVVGGEVAARIYPVTGLDIYANYAFNRSFVSQSQLRTEEERTSQHKLNLGVQYRAPFGLDLSVDFHWVSDQVWLEQVFDAQEGVSLEEFPVDAYHLVNARAGFRLFDDQLDLGVAVYNLTRNRIRNHPFGQRLDSRVMATAAYHF